MIIEASAPVRIDLAGGAFDVHPLYLFEGGGVTVNMAVDIRCAWRRARTTRYTFIRLTSG